MARQVEQLRERVDSGENHSESENDGTQCHGDERCLVETYARNVESSCPKGADGLSAQPEEVPSDKARHWKGALEGCRST